MRELLILFLISLFFYSCNHECESKSYHDKSIIEGIKFDRRKNLHNSNFSRTNRMMNPIYDVFIEEIKSNPKFEKSIYCLDTLIENDNEFFDSQFKKDSIFQILNSSSSSRFSKQTILLYSFNKKAYQLTYFRYSCHTEKIAVVSLDTIYYPRNRFFHFSKMLTYQSSDTMKVIDMAFQDENFEWNRDTISTFTEKEFITVPLKMKYINPVTNIERVFHSKMVVGVFDPRR